MARINTPKTTKTLVAGQNLINTSHPLGSCRLTRGTKSQQ